MEKYTFKKVRPDIDSEMKDSEFKRMFNAERMKLEIAHHLTLLREESHITQRELAKRMKVSQQVISRIEGGSLNLTLETLYKYVLVTKGSIQFKFTPKVKSPSFVIVHSKLHDKRKLVAA